MTPTQKTAIEVNRVLDSLVALGGRLACHEDVPEDALVLAAGDVRAACRVLHDAVEALRSILQSSEDNGGGAIPRQVLDRIDESDT